jgi:hypothetical protein
MDIAGSYAAEEDGITEKGSVSSGLGKVWLWRVGEGKTATTLKVRN